MANENLVNSPNNKVVIIGQVTKYDNDVYTIKPVEVTLGKINPDTKDFVCMFNNRTFPELKEVIRDEEEVEEKLYYLAPIDLDELIEKFHVDEKEDGAENTAMVIYLKNIREHVIEAKKNNDELDVRFIEKSKLKKLPVEPNLNAIEKPTIIVPNEEIAIPDLEEIVTPSTYVNPLGVKIDLQYFIKYMKERIMNNDDKIKYICKTISYNLTAADPYDVENILAIGPTGSGKTETINTIREWAKGYNIPVAIFDSTSLSSAGYKGKDVEDFLKRIYFDSGKNPALFERAIFALDEFDKLKNSELGMKEAAQQSLLKVIEGGIFDVEIDKFGSTVKMDTTGMTIYGLGAFSDIFEKKSKEHQGIGFKSDISNEQIEKIIYDIKDKDIIKNGFMPELIGRFPNRFVYKKLDKDGLRNVLTKSKRSVMLRKFKRLLEQFNTEVDYDDSFLDAFIEKTLSSELGARSLNRIYSETLSDAEADIMIADYEDGGKKKVLKLTSDIFTDSTKFELK